MSSCIVVLYTTVFALAGTVWGQSTGPASVPEADRLYAARGAGSEARRAAELWSGALERNPQDFESAWKLARACYWLGSHLKGDELRRQFERGMTAGQAAIRIAPDRPDGHFWLAANMAGLAESQGMRAGLRYRTPIRENLEKVLQIDPAYQQGSADRALGRWYFKVPGLFGGSKKESEAHLRKSLTYNPQSTASWYFLAETLIALDRQSETRAALQKVIDAPFDPDWTPEDKEWKEKARLKLSELR